MTGPRVGAILTDRLREHPARVIRRPVAAAGRRPGQPRDDLFRNAYALILNTGLSGGLGVLYWMLAARLYPPDVVGRNAALISAMMTLSTVAQLDMAAALMRFLPTMRALAARAVAGSYVLAVAVSIAMAIGFVAIGPRISSNLTFVNGTTILVIFGAGLALWSVFAIQDGVLTGLQRTTVVPIENTAYNLVKTASLALFAGWLPAWGIFVSWTIPLLAANVIVNVYIFRRYLPSHVARPPSPIVLSRRTVVRYLGFDYLGGLCGAVQTMAMPLLVTVTLGATANAHFYVAWMIATLLDTVSLSLGKSLLVEGSYRPDQLVWLGRRLLKGMLLILIPSVAVAAVCSPLAMHLFGAQYRDTSTLLRLLLLGLIPRALFSLTASVARVRGEVGRILSYVVAGTVAIVGLSVVGALYFGSAAGLCLGWTLGNVATGVVALPWLRALLAEPDRRNIVTPEPRRAGI